MTEVRKFTTGAIRDKDDSKEDYSETISWTAFKRYSQFMTRQKAKYGSGNFKKGIPIESYEQSLLRHVQKYMENKYEQGTVEVDYDHLSAMVFNIFGIMHEEGRIRKDETTSNKNGTGTETATSRRI
jgi:hypothetical protein